MIFIIKNINKKQMSIRFVCNHSIQNLNINTCSGTRTAVTATFTVCRHEEQGSKKGLRPRGRALGVGRGSWEPAAPK